MDENLLTPTNPGEDGNPPLPPLGNTEPGKSIQNQNVDKPGVFKAVDLQFKPNAVPVNSDIVDDISDIFRNPPQVNPQEPNADSSGVDTKNKELEKTKLAYSESSKEAIKLAEEKKQYEPFIPILDRMRKDPALIRYVDDYLKKGTTPTDMLASLGIDKETFEYEGSDIINPGSDSFKVLNAVIGNAIGQRFDTFTKENNINMKQMQDEQRFKSDLKMDDKAFAEFRTFANSKIKDFNYEDMHYLYTREEREKGIAKNAQDETLEQINRANAISFPQGQGISSTPQVNSEIDWYNSIFGNPLEKKEDSLII